MRHVPAIPADDHARFASPVCGFEQAQDPEPAPPNMSDKRSHQLDDFTLLGPLGRGNMGTVFLVLSHCDPYALKITHSPSSKKQRSHTERDILASLDHPFLQKLHAHFEFGKHSLFLLDFCSGGDLNLLRHRQPERRFSETAARFYAAEVLVALGELHNLGIVYRDLKPENILVQGSGHIKLTDFDLSLKLRETAGNAAAASLLRGPALLSTLEQQISAEAKLETSRAIFHFQAGFRKEWTVEKPRKALFNCNFTFVGEGAAHRIASERPKVLKQSRNFCKLQFLDFNEKACLRRRRRTKTDYCEEGRFRRAFQPQAGESKAVKRCKGNRRNKVCRRWICLPGSHSSKERRKTEGSYVCVVGTDEYVAPEVLKGDEQGFPMDWWSYGVLLYEMIYGYTPFKGHSIQKTLRNILEQEPEFPGIESPAKHLLAKLLVKDPTARLGTAGGAEEIKQHPFFRGVDWNFLPQLCRPPFIPPSLCLSELEERYPSNAKSRKEVAQNEVQETPAVGSRTSKFWLHDVVEGIEAAERYEKASSQYSPSSSAGFQSSADGGDRKLRRVGDVDARFSSADWSSELEAGKHTPSLM